MRTRLTAVVGLVLGFALLTLSAVPAAANTVGVEITSGQIDVRDWADPTGTPLASFLIDGGTDGCGQPLVPTEVSAIPTSGGHGNLAFSLHYYDTVEHPPGSLHNWVVYVSVTLFGTYTGNGTAITIDSGSAVATVHTRTGTSGCTPDVLVCTIEATGFTGSGAMTTGDDLPTLTTGERATITIANGAFMTAATDVDGDGCGAWSAISDNIIEATITVEVT